MADCKKYNKMFEKSLYGELKSSDETKLKLHFKECPSCESEYSELKTTLELYKSNDLVEPNPIFLDSLWSKLEPELEIINDNRSKTSSLISKVLNWFYIQPKWSYQLATGLSLLIIGIFIGRFYFNSDSVIKNNLESPKTDNNNIQLASQLKAARYVDRSKVLLLGLVNMDADEVAPINLQHQKRISRELITVGTELKNELSTTSNRRLKELVTDLEVILLQIANIESEYDLSWIDLVKTGVDQRGIFLKINIQKMQNSNSQFDIMNKRSEINNKNI